MKKYFVLLFCIAVVVSCGRGRNSDGSAGQEAAGQNTHTHADGTVCTGDHGHESHDHESRGHDGHDHATAHVHEDGTECTGDHGHADDGHDHGKAHVHADGSACTANHDHSGHSHDDHSGHSHDTDEGHSHDAHAGLPHGDHDGHNHDGHDHGSENPDEIEFPASQAAKIDFKVEEVVPAVFTDVIKASGRIIPAQGQEVTLAAPVSGIVSFAGANLAQGSRVDAQNLFYVSARNVGGGDAAAKAEAAYLRAKADYERAQGLVADRIVSQREFDAITAEYRQAKAEYDALAAAQTDRGTRVASPIAGYVTSLAVNEGDFVEMGQTLATVSQNRRLTLRADVSQRYYQRLGSVRGANFTVPYENATYNIADLGGRLISVGQSSGGASSLIPVTFEFDNNGAVVPGSYVEVHLLGSPVANALTLPISAITEQQGLHYVFVQLSADHYERRPVTIGPDDGKRIRITSGIRAGEKVVTRGAVNVKLAGASGAIPHSHEH